ncbi:hypothetical protein KFU94_30820 [Chloroflexi bacterium TSY]|nr:hypothetical protein [Chloroflexi bacterium TSY]
MQQATGPTNRIVIGIGHHIVAGDTILIGNDRRIDTDVPPENAKVVSVSGNEVQLEGNLSESHPTGTAVSFSPIDIKTAFKSCIYGSTKPQIRADDDVKTLFRIKYSVTGCELGSSALFRNYRTYLGDSPSWSPDKRSPAIIHRPFLQVPNEPEDGMFVFARPDHWKLDELSDFAHPSVPAAYSHGWYALPLVRTKAMISTQLTEPIAPGSAMIESVEFDGASLGDFALASIAGTIHELSISAHVNQPNKVTVVLTNNTATAIPPGDQTIRVMLFKH